jgi:hypothetical protein
MLGLILLFLHQIWFPKIFSLGLIDCSILVLTIPIHVLLLLGIRGVFVFIVRVWFIRLRYVEHQLELRVNTHFPQNFELHFCFHSSFRANLDLPLLLLWWGYFSFIYSHTGVLFLRHNLLSLAQFLEVNECGRRLLLDWWRNDHVF